MNDESLAAESTLKTVVGAAWLAEHLDDPRVRVLDTRGRVPAPGTPARSMRSEFEAGHVPGAAFVEWTRTFVDTDDPVPNQLARPAAFANAATGLGIGDDTLVVAYDDYHGIFAARLWWAFRAMGHDAVRVLDGGLAAWRDAGHPLESGPARPRPAAPFHPSPRASLLIDAHGVDEVVARRPPGTVLLDARSPDRFAGAGSDPVGGHIPGAVNVPYAALTDRDGRLRSSDELRAAFAAAGIDPAAPPQRIVATCGSGTSAAVPLLALATLGVDGVTTAIYDGSWNEWSRTGRPVATGADPG